MKRYEVLKALDNISEYSDAEIAANAEFIRKVALAAYQSDSGGVRWDGLQRLKHECGRGDKFAVEVYPADNDVVNVANMRHLWVLPEIPEYAWKVAG